MSARNFTISTPAQSVRADATGRADVVYTVANTSGLPTRAMARAVPLGETRAEWLAVEGETERDFPIGTIHQFTVSAKLPSSGRYSLRLDILSARKGGEEAYAGPVVVIESTANAAPTPSRWWVWVVAAVLVLIVGVAGALVMRAPTYVPNEREADTTASTDTTPSTATSATTRSIEEVEDLVTVPNLISTPVAKAEWDLEAAGLRAVRKEIADRVATPGTVRTSSPRPGEQVARGTIVELEVVVNPAALGLIPVPDVVGLPVESAKRAIENAGLVAEATEGITLYRGEHQRYQPAVIADQLPKGGTDVKKGTKIELWYLGKP